MNATLGKLKRPLRDEIALGPLARLPTLQARTVRYIQRVLRLCGGDVTKAARVLGIGRASLYRLIGGLGVETKGARERREFESAKAKLEEAKRVAWASRKFNTL